MAITRVAPFTINDYTPSRFGFYYEGVVGSLGQETSLAKTVEMKVDLDLNTSVDLQVSEAIKSFEKELFTRLNEENLDQSELLYYAPNEIFNTNQKGKPFYVYVKKDDYAQMGCVTLSSQYIRKSDFAALERAYEDGKRAERLRIIEGFESLTGL